MERKFRVINRTYEIYNGKEITYEVGDIVSLEIVNRVEQQRNYQDNDCFETTYYFQEISPAEEILKWIVKSSQNKSLETAPYGWDVSFDVRELELTDEELNLLSSMEDKNDNEDDW